MKLFSRRGFLASLRGLAALLLLRAPAARAAVESLAPIIDQVTGGALLQSGRVKLEIPQLADNGNAVPLKVSVESPMTEADHVRSIHILSEKNPRPVIAAFHFGPKAGRAQVATRVRLNGTQRLVAIAAMSDGSFWSDTVEVVVTISACLDESQPAMLSRIQMPREAKRGEVIEIRIVIQHPMETGFRYDNMGRAIPKNVINHLVCRYNGAEVFRAEMGSGIAANPYLQFYAVAEASGEFEFDWVDDAGQRGADRAVITVTG